MAQSVPLEDEASDPYVLGCYEKWMGSYVWVFFPSVWYEQGWNQGEGSEEQNLSPFPLQVKNQDK